MNAFSNIVGVYIDFAAHTDMRKPLPLPSSLIEEALAHRGIVTARPIADMKEVMTLFRERDLRLMLLGARRLKIPLIIGSTGTAGADPHLHWGYDILKEIAAAENLKFKAALIHSEQDKAYLQKRLGEGRIKPLDPAPEFNAQVIERSSHIVGMMGAEPFMKALDSGADVVLAARASDAASWAGCAMSRGMAAAPSWYSGKMLECGTASATPKGHDCLVATVRGNDLGRDLGVCGGFGGGHRGPGSCGN
mgnify:CR=1 FL=1